MKRILTFSLLALMLACLLAFAASAETLSGTCGTNVTWTLDTESGVLTVDGSGEMNDFYSDGSQPWYACKDSVKTIVIDNGVTNIGRYAFRGCSNLTGVTIGSSVTSIGASAFFGCSALDGVTLPTSLLSIGNAAFYNCIGLSSITIPNSVTGIGENAFSGCSNLNGVTMGNGVKRIDCSAFASCSSLTYVDIYDMSAWCSILFISYDSNPLYNGAVLYLNGKKVTNLQIPDGTKSVGDYAFYGYGSMTRATIPGSVSTIGECAFNNCTNLSSVTIENGVMNIGFAAFRDCRGLNDVTIPDSVTSIGGEAFRNCISLSSVTIPTGVKTIGNGAFLYCNSLTDVTIPETVSSISANTFASCAALVSVTIPNSVTSIGASAFSGCKRLESVTLPVGVTSIGASAFKDCSSLNDVTIPYSVTSIGESAFSGCSRLSRVSISDVSAWCNIAFGDTSYASPLYVAHNLYLNGSLVSKLYLPDGMSTVKSYAFSNATCLTSVVIPKSVTVISQNAFAGCSSIKDVYYEGTAEEWESVRIGINNGSLDTAAIHLNETSVFTVKYYAGTDDTVTEIPAAGSAYGSYTLPETVPVRVGYLFCGWALAADSPAADYQPGARLDIYQDTDFYAVWAPGAKYALGTITIMDGSYNVIDAIPDDSFIAEVQLTNFSATEAGKLLLVTYDADGRMLELRYLYADIPAGQTITFGASISNPDGKAAKVKALVIADFQSFQPLAETVEVTKA